VLPATTAGDFPVFTPAQAGTQLTLLPLKSCSIIQLAYVSRFIIILQYSEIDLVVQNIMPGGWCLLIKHWQQVYVGVLLVVGAGDVFHPQSSRLAVYTARVEVAG